MEKRVLDFNGNVEEFKANLEYAFSKTDALHVIYFFNFVPLANVGSMSESIVLEVYTFLENRRNAPQHADLVRYQRFNGETDKNLLYIKSITENDKLVMVFDGIFPLGQAKTQTNQVMNYLQNPAEYKSTDEAQTPMAAEGGAAQAPEEPDSIEAEQASEAPDSTETGQEAEAPGPHEVKPEIAIEVDSSLSSEEAGLVTVNELVSETVDLDPQEPGDLSEQIEETAPHADTSIPDLLSDWFEEENEPEAENGEAPTEAGDEWKNTDFLEGIAFPWEKESPSPRTEAAAEAGSALETPVEPAGDAAHPGETEAIPPETPAEDLKPFLEQVAEELPLAESPEQPETEWVNETGIHPDDDIRILFSEEDLIPMEIAETEFAEEIPEQETPPERPEAAQTPTDDAVAGNVDAVQPQMGKMDSGSAVDDREEIGSGVSEDDREDIEKTQPRRIALEQKIESIILQPPSPELVSLHYTIVLIPRYPQHLLTGKTAKKLGSWIPDFCLTHDWRLEHLAVRPQYLLWKVSVPPAVPPLKLVTRMRKATSKRLLKQLADGPAETAARDFWAPGYLLIAGDAAPTQEMITAFLKQIRHYQGIPI